MKELNAAMMSLLMVKKGFLKELSLRQASSFAEIITDIRP